LYLANPQIGVRKVGVREDEPSHFCGFSGWYGEFGFSVLETFLADELAEPPASPAPLMTERLVYLSKLQSAKAALLFG